MYRHKRSASGGFSLVILRDSVAFWYVANTNWLVFEFWLVTVLWPTLFHGTCKYLALVGPWTLMIIGSLCLLHRVHNLLLQLSRPNFPVRWTVFCLDRNALPQMHIAHSQPCHLAITPIQWCPAACSVLRHGNINWLLHVHIDGMKWKSKIDKQSWHFHKSEGDYVIIYAITQCWCTYANVSMAANSRNMNIVRQTDQFRQVQ